MKLNIKWVIYFLPVFIYPPLQFTHLIPPHIRAALLVLLIVALLMSSHRFNKKDFILCAVLTVLYIDFVIINISNDQGLITSSSILLTLVFAYSLCRGSENSEKIKARLLKMYYYLFLLIPIFSLFSIVYYSAFGQYYIFPPYNEGYNYIYTPFGAMLKKNLFGLVVYRSFFFFVEPVYLGFFYAVNMFYFKKEVGSKYNYFLWANFIGGILTFSFLFYFMVLLFLLLKENTILNSVWKKATLVSFLAIMYMVVDIVGDSSSMQRIYRILLFIVTINDSSIIQLLLGHGFVAETGAGRSFSAGLLTSIYEVGIINLIMIVVFFGLLTKNKPAMYGLLLVSMLTFEPIKFPFFWMSMIALANINSDRNKVSVVESISLDGILIAR